MVGWVTSDTLAEKDSCMYVHQQITRIKKFLEQVVQGNLVALQALAS